MNFFSCSLLLLVVGPTKNCVYRLKHQTIEFASPTSATHTHTRASTNIHSTHTHSLAHGRIVRVLTSDYAFAEPKNHLNRSKHSHRTNSATAKRRTRTTTTITMTTTKIRPAWLSPATSIPPNQPYRITMAAVVALYRFEMPNRYLTKPNP